MIELEREAPDLEDLAAYLDGRLSAERRAQVEERLLHDEDYYEVFAENVRYQEEQAAAGGGEVVAPAAWWRSWKVVAPLAMAATLVVAVSLPRLVLGPTPGDWVTRLDVGVIVNSGADWIVPGWSVLRGDSAPGALQPDLRRQQELAFRIGTRTVDLQVALTGGDHAAARQSAAQLETLTFEDPVLVVISNGYREIKDHIENETLDVLNTRAAELEEYLAEDGFEGTPAERYKLGRWNEAGRLAALAKDAEVLAGIWRRQQVALGIPEIADHLETLEAVLEQPELDFAAGEAAFSEIARALAGRG